MTEMPAKQGDSLLSGLLVWIGDHLPGRFGDWLLRRFSPVEPEPWVDAEGRIYRG